MQRGTGVRRALLLVAAWVGGAGGVFSAADADAEFARLAAGLARVRAAGAAYEAEYVHLCAQAVNKEAVPSSADRDPVDVVVRRTAALLARVRALPGAGDFGAQADALARVAEENARVPVADTAARKELFVRVCALRRGVALRNPLLAGIDRLLFVARHLSRYDHMCDQFYGHAAVPGGGLVVLERPFADDSRARDLLADAVCETGRLAGRKLAGGAFLAPDVSFDGRTVLFAYTEADLEGTPYDGERGKWAPRCVYHVFRVRSDGTGLAQLTDGAWNDFDPCWLPGGRIAFVSERRGGYLRCSGQRPCPLYTLHSMREDGGDIACLSPHESHEWQPSVDNDGMLVYTRWDYVDRGGLQAHHPWRMTPDGRDARALHGNYPAAGDGRPNMELDLRAIPGSHKLAGTAAPHHGQAFGALVLIDPSIPDDDRMAQLRRITPDARFPECEVGAGDDWYYATPWPLSEEFYLCAYSPNARQGAYGIYLIDVFGNRELLYRDPAISCMSPMPLAPRAMPPMVPSRASATESAERAAHGGDPARATMAVTNVYNSRAPFPAGTRIAALRVIQILPKSTPVHHAPQIGYGCETSARAVLGTVPVEADGSAYFCVPAGKGVYFQALDERGLAVQSMRSETWARAGETLTCRGCHESRATAPVAGAATPRALLRPPSEILPEAEGSNPFSFPRLVQPVLDARCAACHREDRGGRAPELGRGAWAGDEFRWYASYRSLGPYAFHYGAPRWTNGDYDAWTSSRSVPGEFGARASRLYALLAAGHHEVRLAPEELRRITLWLDCNSDFFGAYDDVEAQSRAEVVRPALE
jgi:hypothetical protein